MGVRLAELLADVREVASSPTLVDALRTDLDAAARRATDGVAADRLPLRLTKDRITRVLACEAYAIDGQGDEGFDLSEPVVRGRVLDRLLHHHVHGLGGPPADGPALAVAEGAFEAERDDAVVEWLLDDTERRQRLAEDATAFTEHLATFGPVDAAWWPRCEDRLRVDLADRSVHCTAQLDLVLGGRPTDRPLVVVEVKSGRFGQDHRDGLLWYALLATLRHGAPPAAVVAWSAWDGSGWCQPVTEPLLRAALARAGDALDRLGELARGREPTRTACRACTWCALRPTCTVAAERGEDDDDG